MNSTQGYAQKNSDRRKDGRDLQSDGLLHEQEELLGGAHIFQNEGQGGHPHEFIKKGKLSH